jgi:hypothetical protein
MRPLHWLGGSSLALVAVTLALAGTAASTLSPPDGPDDERMSVPGGTATLLKAARITARVESPRAWLVLARALHGGLPPDGSPFRVASIEPYLADGARREDSETDQVPALLPRAVWEQAVFGRPVDPAQLAFSILRDRRAALLYTGLFSLDPETLAYFAAHPSLVSSIYSDHSGPFAAFAESLTVRAAQVVLPDGASRTREWEQLVGAPAGEPDRFIPALLGRDGGRLAWLFDTLASLGAARRMFALQGGLEGLYGAFALEQVPVDFSLRPFTRPPIDLTILLRTIDVASDGTLAPPRDALLWNRVFSAGGPVVTGTEVNTGWLLRSFASVPVRERRLRLDTLLFAQRVFPSRSGAALSRPAQDLLAQALSAYRGHSALMLTLEGLGFTDPLDFVNAARAADGLASGIDRSRASLRLATFQGALAVVARLHEVDTIDERSARNLALALIKLPTSDPQGYSDSVARWIESLVLPSLSGTRGPAAADAEQRLLDGLAGIGDGRALPVITWEDQTYRVDIAAGERSRLRRIRDRQGGNDLTTVLHLRQMKTQGDPNLASTLSGIISRLGLRDARTLFAASGAAAGSEAKGGGAKTGARVDQGSNWQEVLLAELMASYAYAIAIGDPDSPLLLAGNPARVHDFDIGGSGSCLLARSVRAGSQLIMRGSLLGLDRALAVSSLRQATLNAPAVAPNLGQVDLQGIAESVAAMNPFRLEDGGRDALAAALRRGRERIATAAHDRSDIDALAEHAGVERWRRRLMRLAAGGGDAAVMQYWSLGEVCGVGQMDTIAADPRGWGVAQRLRDGSWEQALPVRLSVHDLGGRLGMGLLSAQSADLQLRVVEWLAELKLPAGLAPGVLRAAAWDLAMNTQMADLDDWLALIRTAQALPADRMADHVSALTSDGPLVPVAQAKH